MRTFTGKHDGPLPYSGNQDRRGDLVGTPHELRQCARDLSRSVTYSYNTLGYRGPEYVDDAKFRVFIFGESNTFGVGVDDEDTWGRRSAHLIADALAVPRDERCVMNFADSGTSNAAIARLVVSQCVNLRPDLVLIGLAARDRTEGMLGDRPFPVGPWFKEVDVEASAAIYEDEADRNRVRESHARGLHYLEFSNEERDRLVMAQEIVLMQSFLMNQGIPTAMMIPGWLDPANKGFHGHPVIGPVCKAIDPAQLVVRRRPQLLLDTSADGEHYGPRTHSSIADSVLEHFTTTGKLERIRQSMSARDEANTGDRVRSFYDQLPFNLHKDASTAEDSIRKHTLEHSYPDLHEALKSGRIRTAIDAGCGAGWLANTLAYHYDIEVMAIDFCSAALHRARTVAANLGIAERVRFIESDLFEVRTPEQVDLVVSLGVLHHTHDCRGAVEHILSARKPDGILYLGLYHRYGRGPFLDLFRNLIATEGEDAALARYRQLDGIHAEDETMLRSWFRDQVRHPHETQHSLEEVYGWLLEAGQLVRSTSINQFAPLPEPVGLLFEEEKKFEERSYQANAVQGRYFPGFFTVLAEAKPID